MRNTESKTGRVAAVMLLATGLALATTGCSTAGDSSDTVTVDTPQSAAAPFAFAEDFPETDPEQLENYVDNLRFDADILDDFARMTSVTYPCPATGCGANGYVKEARFLVVAERGTHNLRWENWVGGTQTRARVVAVFINLDSVDVPFPNGVVLKAGDRMHLWIGHVRANHDRGVALYTFNSATRTVSEISYAPSFMKCTDPKHPRGKAIAKITPDHACDGALFPAGAAPPGPGVDRFPDNLWIGCDQGCCKSSPTRGAPTPG